jgi:hypothetical protein
MVFLARGLSYVKVYPIYARSAGSNQFKFHNVTG